MRARDDVYPALIIDRRRVADKGAHEFLAIHHAIRQINLVEQFQVARNRIHRAVLRADDKRPIVGNVDPQRDDTFASGTWQFEFLFQHDVRIRIVVDSVTEFADGLVTGCAIGVEHEDVVVLVDQAISALHAALNARRQRRHQHIEHGLAGQLVGPGKPVFDFLGAVELALMQHIG